MLPARIQLPQDYNLQQLLTEIFEQFPINRLQYYIWRWYRAAMEYQPYHYCNCPSRVLDMHQTLETFMLLAVHLENELPEATKLEHPVYASDAFNRDILFNKGLSNIYEASEGVIRHLFEAEAANPALFFVRFFKWKSAEAWITLLDDWQEFALNSAGMDEIWNIEEMPEAMELLLGLCETFYLLWKPITNQTAPTIMPEPAVNPAPDTSSTVVNDQVSSENTGPQPPDTAILDELFDYMDIEMLQLELWQWFLSIFRHEPFCFSNDPSILLSLKRMMSGFVGFASQWFRDYSESLPAMDPSADDRERLRNYKPLLDRYNGRVTCLTLEETKLPGLFFRRFFTTMDAEAWEYLLNDWLETGLGQSSITNNSDVEDMPEAFELLKGLAEACWLIWEDFENDEGEGEKEENKGENVGEIKVKDKVENESENKAEIGASPERDEDLQAIIEMIRQSIDVEMIFLLGKFALQPAALGNEYCLMVLGNYKNGKPMDELESIIRNRTHELPPVFATVMQTKKVAHLLQHGNWFMHRWCAPEKQVYQAGDSTLPYQPEVKPPSPEQMLETYRIHYNKASSFLSGARSFFAQEEYALSGFMLHQSMEAALMAMLVPAMQHSFRTHSLHKLLCMVRHLSPEIGKPFPRDTEEEIILFQLLQKAYIHARYKDNFSIGRAQCEALITRVASVIDILPGEFGQVVMAIHGGES